jgi:uncharacterized membrane protein (UPF0127 family)
MLRKIKTPAFIAIIFCLLAFFVHHHSLFSGCSKVNAQRFFTPSAIAAESPQFTKEGELIFLGEKNRKEITKIDIEIADSDFERTRGLMNRRSLPDNAGMLFIFEQSEPLSFWMRNTYIPLDIIFADEKKQVIKISKKTEPLSYNAIRSIKNAKYVVEVNAGFCDKHGITIGDWLTFRTITRQHQALSP